ncbi:RBCK1 isoform 15 [Pongo abelii]|uniref:RANBP2-type and C3HC4-type zinc finger containing 1 n=1 Tax=Pongo abelii TaxID=9601 RepID=A0A2J8VIE5_PONAB|nr:RBCK1 isoform 15 [Pongo abelii]
MGTATPDGREDQERFLMVQNGHSSSIQPSHHRTKGRKTPLHTPLKSIAQKLYTLLPLIPMDQN